MNKFLPLMVSALLMTGAGCIDVPEEHTPTDLDLTVGGKIHLQRKNFSLLPGSNDGPFWEVQIDQLTLGEELSGKWNKFEQRETAESIAAREAAENSGIGEGAEVPDAVYEQIATEGTFSTTALDQAKATILPTFLKADANFTGGEDNGVFWLSQQQYDELVDSRHTELELNVFGSGIASLIETAGGLDKLVERFGITNADDINLEDLTTIEAETDWGSYTVKVDGDNKKLQTIEASNRFVHYVILANRDNPLVLEVELDVLGVGTELLANFGGFEELKGYHVTELNGFKSNAPTSEHPPELQGQ